MLPSWSSASARMSCLMRASMSFKREASIPAPHIQREAISSTHREKWAAEEWIKFGERKNPAENECGSVPWKSFMLRNGYSSSLRAHTNRKPRKPMSKVGSREDGTGDDDSAPQHERAIVDVQDGFLAQVHPQSAPAVRSPAVHHVQHGADAACTKQTHARHSVRKPQPQL